MNERHEALPVVVGYDGSPARDNALRWAVEEAELRGGLALVACHAWHWPYPFRRPDPSTFETVRAMGCPCSTKVAKPREAGI